jgi:PTH1 family peptidyl-tRNA hydrolase
LWLVVGLGNPGAKYAGSRHNVGFMGVDALARANGLAFGRMRGKAKAAEGRINGKDVVLAKPQTFMNLSGEAVGWLAQKYGVKAPRIIVIHDEMDLPLGKIRIRAGGSSAGHKGIDSIMERLGNGDFIRVRVGIGRPGEESRAREEVIGHVLGPLEPQEQAVMEKVTAAVQEAVATILGEGLAAAMNRYNGMDYGGKG